MSLKLKAEDIKQIVDYRILPELRERGYSFNFEQFAVGNMVKRNGADFRLEGFFDVSEEGILFVQAHQLDVSHADTNYLLLEFADIQGIKIKKRAKLKRVIFQLKDGRNYHFDLFNRFRRRYPDQRANTDRIVEILQDKHLTNMEHELHKENKQKERLSGFIYFITLLPLLVIPVIINPDAIFGHGKGRAYVFAFGMLIIHGLLYFLYYHFFVARKSKAFLKEYNAIAERYEAHKDADLCIQDLKEMEVEPHTEADEAVYHLTLADLHIIAEKYDEAEDYLNKVKITEERIIHQKKILEDALKEAREGKSFSR